MISIQFKVLERRLDDEFSGLEQNDIIIVVVGHPKVGKRTFINFVEKENRSDQNETTSGQQSRFLGENQVLYTRFFSPMHGRNVVLAEVPGFDTKNKAEPDFTNLQSWIRRLSQRKLSIYGILYLHSIVDKKNLVDLRSQLDNVCEGLEIALPKRAILATTKWDGNSTGTEAESRQKELQESWVNSWADCDTDVQSLLLEQSAESARDLMHGFLGVTEGRILEGWVKLERTTNNGAVREECMTLETPVEAEEKEKLLEKLKEARIRELQERDAKEAALKELKEAQARESYERSVKKEALRRELQERKARDVLVLARQALEDQVESLKEEAKAREKRIRLLEQDASNASQREARTKRASDDLGRMKDERERQLEIFEKQIKELEAKVISDRESLKRELKEKNMRLEAMELELELAKETKP